MLKYFSIQLDQSLAKHFDRMRNRINFAFLILPIALAMLACRISLPWQDQSSGAILFQDDFSDPSSGWNQVITESGMTDYADGMYIILVNKPNLDVWARPGLNFTNTIIEVDTFKVGGDRNNRFGVICRLNGNDNFYSFLISSDGYYGIGKVTGGAYELIGMNALQPSEAIKQGSDINRIRVECVGDRLTLLVNSEKVAEAKDSSFQHGDVGLIAGTYDIPGTDIRFDNLVITHP